MPDDSERAAGGTLPDDPEADTAPMPTPGLAPTLGELLPAAFARMRARHEGKETAIPMPWDTLTTPLGGGLWPGLHVFVGNTATGKTSFCLQVALHAAQKGTPVLYVALEAGDVEFVARCLGLVAGIHWNGFYHGRHDGLEARLLEHTPALENLPLHVLLAPPHGWHAHELPAAVEALRAAHPQTSADQPVLVILDYLQIIGAEKGEDLRERIGRAAYVCRGVARTHNAAVLVASSTARENYLALTGRTRNAKKGGAVETATEKLGQGAPGRLVGLGKESGEVEYSADTVLTLTQEPWEGNTPPPGGTVCHLALAKVRAGVQAWVELRFDGRAFTKPEPATKGTVSA